jgi:hypothetical protein
LSALIKVNLKEAFCKKPGCKKARRHRHHRGHEFLFAIRWQAILEDPSLANYFKDADKIAEWVKRYWSFHHDDIVDLCANHHAEIHLIYDRYIMAHNRKKGYRLDLYSYQDAVELRDLLRAVCDEWLKKESKGVSPNKVFGRFRTKNQRRAKDGGKKKDRNDKNESGKSEGERN